jgi:hypothetical protein
VAQIVSHHPASLGNHGVHEVTAAARDLSSPESELVPRAQPFGLGGEEAPERLDSLLSVRN